MEHWLPAFPASRSTESLAHSPSLHPHSKQGSISRLYASDPIHPSYKDLVMTLGAQGSFPFQRP